MKVQKGKRPSLTELLQYKNSKECFEGKTEYVCDLCVLANKCRRKKNG